MKELKKYEACEIEIIILSDDVITSSVGINGVEDEFYPTTYEW